MSWTVLFGLYIVCILVLLSFGLWISIALGVVGILGMWVLDPSGSFINGLGSLMFNSVASFELSAVPLFFLMGELILRSDVSKRFYQGASLWLRKIPGGLLQSNIVTCAFFAAISGSSVATAAAIGGVAYPEQNKRGYDKKMVLGSLAAGGTLGILIPPSVVMIVYGSITSESVVKLFAAGIIPGILATMIFMIFIIIRAKVNPSLVPVPVKSVNFTIKEKCVAFLNMCPFFIIIFLVLGGIYLGWTTPTEAAALGVVTSVAFCLFFRRLTWKVIVDSLTGAVVNTSMIIFIMVGAKIFSYMIVYTGINRQITTFAASLNLSIFGFMMFIILLYMVLGCLMDAMSQMFLTLPLLLPILTTFNIDLIWFGVIMVILLEIGHLTPPLGLNVFVLQSISGRSAAEVLEGTLPYWGLLLAVVFIVILFPCLATWLPRLL